MVEGCLYCGKDLLYQQDMELGAHKKCDDQDKEYERRINDFLDEILGEGK